MTCGCTACAAKLATVLVWPVMTCTLFLVRMSQTWTTSQNKKRCQKKKKKKGTYADGAVTATREQEVQRGMESARVHAREVPVVVSDDLVDLEVPALDELIVTDREQVGRAFTHGHAADAADVPGERDLERAAGQIPHLDRLVGRARHKPLVARLHGDAAHPAEVARNDLTITFQYGIIKLSRTRMSFHGACHLGFGTLCMLDVARAELCAAADWMSALMGSFCFSTRAVDSDDDAGFPVAAAAAPAPPCFPCCWAASTSCGSSTTVAYSSAILLASLSFWLFFFLCS